MIWAIIALRILFWGAVGSFGTAYLHERTGRDVAMGGLIGLVVGAVGGIFFLMLLWVWLYYVQSAPIGRVYNARRRWYRWWD
ncbi:MAG: hypothetical protein MUF87_04260 [Anaerolineae bacterium]|jgi:hypothetical protein|nr:hypothetical protein [Anaerolineae bacterium]